MSNKMSLQFKLINNFVNPLEPTSKDDFTFGKVFNLTDGIGDNKAEVIWHDSRTLTASSEEDLDLNGVLIGAFGVAKAFTKVKGLLFFAEPGNTNDVVFGNASSNQFLFLGVATGVITLPPGGFNYMFIPSAAGIAVTPATGDLLKVLNGGGGSSVTYTIAVIGEIT